MAEEQGTAPLPPQGATTAPPSQPNAPSAQPGGGAPGATAGSPAAPAGDAAEARTVVDAVADLLQTVVDWLRQEAEAIVRDKVAQPMQKAGMVIAWAMAAAMAFILGAGFVAVGAMILLAQFVGWPAALFIIGGVFIVGCVVFTVLKMRSMQS